MNTFSKEFFKTWTVVNIKTKVNSLCKTSKAQRVNIVKLIGGTPFVWHWYKIYDKIWRCIPKAAGILGAKEIEKICSMYGR